MPQHPDRKWRQSLVVDKNRIDDEFLKLSVKKNNPKIKVKIEKIEKMVKTQFPSSQPEWNTQDTQEYL